MIHLLVLAVAETPGMKLSPLPCAVNDGRHVYTAFVRTCSDEFDDALSAVVVNPSASQAREFLLHAAAGAGAGDTLIVYISSHGVLRGGRLSLPFVDATPSGFGCLETGEIASVLRRSRSQVLMVVDCCFSGAALMEAHLADLYDTPRISVVASALPYGKASYDAQGSHFTLAFVRSIQRVTGLGKALTVNSIVDSIEGDDVYSGEALVNLAEGCSDLEIAPAPKWYRSVSEDGDFEKRFLDRLTRSPLHTREMLWYSLDSIPDGLKLNIFHLLLERQPLREPSWLVRRAMGTVISGIDDVHPKKRKIILGLLTARNWMHACTGLVAGRHSLGNIEMMQRFRNILKKARRMDATWLANLYLADQSGDNLEVALASPLAKTTWGLVDLWKRYEPHFADPEHLARVISATAADRPDLLRALRTHLDCVGHPVGPVLEVKADRDVVDNELVHFQYRFQSRGLLTRPAVKWLVSSLYGSWRDQLRGDLRHYLENTDHNQILHDIEVCQRIPSVEHRMSLCQELVAWAALEPEIRHAARWTVTDPHPWVRREGLKLFPHNQAVAANALKVATDTRLYPGHIDLVLESHRCGADTTECLRTMTKAEQESITWATSVQATEN